MLETSSDVYRKTQFLITKYTDRDGEHPFYIAFPLSFRSLI